MLTVLVGITSEIRAQIEKMRRAPLGLSLLIRGGDERSTREFVKRGGDER